VHGLGLLIWVVLLFVGVLGSIVSSIRKQAQRGAPAVAARPSPPRPSMPARPAGPAPYTNQAPEPGQLPQWLDRMLAAQAAPPPAVQRPVAPKPVSPKPAPPKPAAPQPFVMEHRAPKARRFFGDNHDLVRAVIAAEVLGKPRGLRDEYPFY